MTTSTVQQMRWVGGTGITATLPTGAGAVVEGQPVKLSSGAMVAIAADGETVFAIAAKDNAASVDGTYHIVSGDLFEVRAGEIVTAGDVVYAEVTTGDVITTGLSTGERSCGVMLESLADQAYGTMVAHLEADRGIAHA